MTQWKSLLSSMGQVQWFILFCITEGIQSNVKYDIQSDTRLSRRLRCTAMLLVRMPGDHCSKCSEDNPWLLQCLSLLVLLLCLMSQTTAVTVPAAAPPGYLYNVYKALIKNGSQHSKPPWLLSKST